MNKPMPLMNKLANIKTTSALLPLTDGKAASFEDFWNNFILPHMPDKTVVIAWHNLLMEYIAKEDITFFIRAFGSYGSKSKNKDVLRRGFYNTTNAGYTAVYCDNFFTSYFYSMAYDGYCPSLDEFESIIKSRRFPCGVIQTKEENQYASFFRGKNPDIAGKGYKIAHVFSAGEDYNSKAINTTLGDFCDKFFNRGVNTDWNNIGTDQYGSYYYRAVNITSSDKKAVRDFLVAHFLRMVHPINYFLVPKKSGATDKKTKIKKTNIVFKDGNVIKDEIGEDPELIAFVKNKLKNEYGAIYTEFLDLIFPNDKTGANNNKKVEIHYGIDVWKKHKKELSNAMIANKKNKKQNNNNNNNNTNNNTTKTPVKTTTAITTPTIVLSPSNPDIFKDELLKKKQAEFTWIYSDGTQEEKIWNAQRFTKDADLYGNIRTRSQWKNRATNGLTEVKVKIL